MTVVNADWEFYFPALKAFDVAFTGTFRDFSSDWFVAVGNLVVNQSVSAAIVPNLAILAKWPKVFVSPPQAVAQLRLRMSLCVCVDVGCWRRVRRRCSRSCSTGS